jgi:hypothetical protein
MVIFSSFLVIFCHFCHFFHHFYVFLDKIHVKHVNTLNVHIYTKALRAVYLICTLIHTNVHCCTRKKRLKT